MPNGIKALHERLQDQDDAYAHHYRLARRWWRFYIVAAALIGFLLGRASS